MANPAQAFSDVFKSFGEFRAPAFDLNQIFSLQRRNIEALYTAQQIVSEGVQTVGKRQAEIVRSNVETAIQATRDLLTSGSPEKNAAKQADLAKNIFQNSLENLREVSEMATKSSFEAIDVLNKRAAQSIEEISTAASGAGAQATAKKK